MGLRRRGWAFVVVLIGSLFYSYNFNVVDYVRPYLIDRMGFSVAQTASLGISQNIGVTAGALGWATIVTRAGHRTAAISILFLMGSVAAIFPLVDDYTRWLLLRGALAATLGGFYVVSTAVVVALFRLELRARLMALTSTAYPASNILLGTVGAWAGDAHWHVLLWLGAAPLILAAFATIIPRPQPPAADDATPEARGGWREMASAAWRWRTMGCVLLSGLDFIAYGFGAAFLTTFLRQQRYMDAAQVGATISLLSAGSIVGALGWAWLSDRRGRRSAGLGYVLAAAAFAAMLFLPLPGGALKVLAIVFGFGLACNSAWGAWFAELFPIHLRPHGAALFHAGHIVAMAGPVFISLFADRLGLVLIMAAAIPVYLMAALIWQLLPETQVRRSEQPN